MGKKDAECPWCGNNNIMCSVNYEKYNGTQKAFCPDCGTYSMELLLDLGYVRYNDKMNDKMDDNRRNRFVLNDKFKLQNKSTRCSECGKPATLTSFRGKKLCRECLCKDDYEAVSIYDTLSKRINTDEGLQYVNNYFPRKND